MDEPLVSIIVPTYNRENFIQKCLASIYNQTYQNFEIILIDDGSKDGTLKSVRSFFNAGAGSGNINSLKDKNKLKYFAFDKNQGIPKALNKGYELASGKYVCQLSSDDWWTSEKLQKQVELMEFEPNERLGLIYSDYMFMDLDEKKTWPVDCFYSRDNKEMFKEMFKGCFMNACTFLMRKEFKDEIGPFSILEHHNWNQDYRFNFLAIAQTKNTWGIYKIPEKLAFITIHSQQASKQGKCGLGNDLLIPEMIKLGKEKGLL